MQRPTILYFKALKDLLVDCGDRRPRFFVLTNIWMAYCELRTLIKQRSGGKKDLCKLLINSSLNIYLASLKILQIVYERGR